MMDVNIAEIAEARDRLSHRLKKSRCFLSWDQTEYVFDWIMGKFGYRYFKGEYVKVLDASKEGL